MSYIVSEKMTLTNIEGTKIKGSKTFDLNGEKTSSGNYLVGFSSFNFSYGEGTDHHVKRMELNICPKLNKDGKHIEVKISGEMSDSSNHLAKLLTITVVIVALTESDKPVEEASVDLVAMQAFETAFSDDDHHIREYTASVQSDGRDGKMIMKDNSGHTGTGSTSGQTLTVPKSVYADLNLLDRNLINYFKIGMNKTDHHVSHTGIEYKNGQATYDLSDNHGNHVDFSDCHVNTWKECKIE